MSLYFDVLPNDLLPSLLVYNSYEELCQLLPNLKGITTFDKLLGLKTITVFYKLFCI